MFIGFTFVYVVNINICLGRSGFDGDHHRFHFREFQVVEGEIFLINRDLLRKCFIAGFFYFQCVSAFFNREAVARSQQFAVQPLLGVSRLGDYGDIDHLACFRFHRIDDSLIYFAGFDLADGFPQAEHVGSIIHFFDVDIGSAWLQDHPIFAFFVYLAVAHRAVDIQIFDAGAYDEHAAEIAVAIVAVFIRQINETGVHGHLAGRLNNFELSCITNRKKVNE